MREGKALANPTTEGERADLLRRYDRLLELTSELTSTLEMNALLDFIVNAAREITESEAASLLLYDPQRNQLHFEAATEQLRSEETQIGVPTDNSIAGWIFTHQKPLLVEDAIDDPRFFREVDLATTYQTHSILGVPLLAKEKTIGVIEAVNKRNGGFDEHDIRMLQALAAQAATAIENTRLFQQSDLVAEMVHELRTPLSALAAAAHLLQHPDLVENQRVKLRETIYNEVQRLNELATNFLELARLESGRFRFIREPVHLEGLVRECLEIMKPQAESQQIELKTEFDRTISPVMGDRAQLKRLLLNLITNAIKYNNAGGYVSIGLEREGENVCLSVADNGRGIPEESLPHMFDRFYRVPDEEGHVAGTGLGLAIAKRIAQNHGGGISVESKLREGTVFRVYLPSEGTRD